MHKIINNSEKIVILTGAGISTDSGIPTFKQAEKEWEHELPRNEIMSIPYFKRNPENFWEIYRTMDFTAKKNKFHKFCEKLSELKNVQIFTQNIDGLHDGKNVTELHGNAKRVICINRQCTQPTYDLNEFNEKIPKCPKCNEILKPDISLFLEGINGFSDVRDAVVDCDLLIVAGTSLTMGPINEIPLYLHWKNENNKSVWINIEEPPKDYEFDYYYLNGSTKFAEEFTNILS